MKPETIEAQAAAADTISPASAIAPTVPPVASSPSQLDFEPRIKGKPDTAPAYDGVLQVQAVPILAGCVSSKNSCHCYTPQATPYPMQYEECLAYMATRHFNPFQAPHVAPVTTQAQTHPPVQTAEKPPALDPSIIGG